MNQSILLSISGKDRPGIVRDVSEVLLQADANIEDSSMAVLRGRFTMMLIVELAAGSDVTALKASLAALEQRTGLSVQSQVLSDDEASMIPQEPDCVITVSGADQSGIVFAVTDALADMSVSIADVSTRERSGVYMMALEVVAGEHQQSLSDKLKAVADKLGVSIELHALDNGVM